MRFLLSPSRFLLCLAAAFTLTSCGDSADTGEPAAADAEEEGVYSGPNILREELVSKLDASEFEISVHEAEMSYLSCVMREDGVRRNWTLTVVRHPEQVKVYAESVEKLRGQPGFQEGVGTAAAWGLNDEPTLTVISRPDLAFVLGSFLDLPLPERVPSLTDPARGGKWRADAVKIAVPVNDRLKAQFPAE